MPAVAASKSYEFPTITIEQPRISILLFDWASFFSET